MERTLHIKQFKQVKCQASKLKMTLLRLLIAFAVGSGSSLILVPLAYAERGCFAIGGEWLGVCMAAFITFSITKKLIKEEKDNE